MDKQIIKNIIITRDYQTQIESDGYKIEVVPIWKWLLYIR